MNSDDLQHRPPKSHVGCMRQLHRERAAQLTPADVQAIRRRKRSGDYHQAARDYGISPDVVWDIWSGRWPGREEGRRVDSVGQVCQTGAHGRRAHPPNDRDER